SASLAGFHEALSSLVQFLKPSASAGITANTPNDNATAAEILMNAFMQSPQITLATAIVAHACGSLSIADAGKNLESLLERFQEAKIAVIFRSQLSRGFRGHSPQRAQICRSTILSLSSAIASEGLRPFGQALAQFMMV